MAKIKYLVLALVAGLFLIHADNAFATNRIMKQSEAKILGGNCNPDADPILDYTKQNSYDKSCKGQGITALNFKVRIEHDANGADLEGSEAMAFVGGMLALSPAVMAGIMIWSATVDEVLEIPLGSRKDSWVTTFSVVREGDKACVYSYVMGTLDFKVNSEAYDPEVESSVPSNCIRIPEFPNNIVKPVWSDVISKTCTEYDTSASQFRYADGTSRAFTGIVVQCIEETMMNLFYNEGSNGSGSVFSLMQDKLIDAIRALLALYVIFLGYKFIIERGGVKQSEWHWIALKMALVLYFAAGPGMVQVLPMLQSFSKGMSLIVMEAAAGNPDDATTVNNQLNAASQTYFSESEKLTSVRTRVATLQHTNAPQSEIDAAKIEVEAQMSIYKNALDEYNRLLSASKSFGYRYCDFRDIPDSYYIVDGNDKSYMRLWDMVDCKISKYLGVGDNPDDLKAPQVLLIGISTIFFPLVLVLVIIFVTFMVLVIVRVVHIYIIAAMVLIILVYISPLLIPAVLFGFTKDVYEMWFKQIMAYTIQPIILFVFLAFLISAIDMFMYGANHKFIPMTPYSQSATDEAKAAKFFENKLCMKDKSKDNASVCTAVDMAKYKYSGSAGYDANFDAANLICDDEQAVACIYQKTIVTTQDFIFGMKIYTSNLVDSGNFFPLVLGLLKLILACYFGYAVLGFVEGMSGTMTNAVGSAAGMSIAPKPSPHAIAATGATATVGAYKLAKAGAAMTGADKAMAGAAGAAASGAGNVARGALGAAGSFGRGALGIGYQAIKEGVKGRDPNSESLSAGQRLKRNVTESAMGVKHGMSDLKSGAYNKALGAGMAVAKGVGSSALQKNLANKANNQMKFQTNRDQGRDAAKANREMGYAKNSLTPEQANQMMMNRDSNPAITPEQANKMMMKAEIDKNPQNRSATSRFINDMKNDGGSGTES